MSVTDCKHANENNPDGLSCQTNLLVPNEALRHSVAASTSTFSQKKLRTLRIPPRRLALCGGGTRCIAHVGVFKALQQEGLLSCVREVLGVSAGALFSLLFSLGYSLQDIERLAVEFDFTMLRTIEPDSLFNFPFTFGLDNGDGIDKFLSSLLMRKGFSSTCTFKELSQKTNILFRCYATDIDTGKVCDFSVHTTPNQSVKFAVRASMSLPVLYQPVVDPATGHFLMDGGVLHNLPLVFQTDEEREHTLAVLFMTEPKPHTKESNVLHVFQSVYDSVTHMRNMPYLTRYKDKVLTIDIKGFSAVSFDETKEQRKELIESAFQQTKEFLYKPFYTPTRRFSCA